jgi:hypothetical protein
MAAVAEAAGATERVSFGVNADFDVLGDDLALGAIALLAGTSAAARFGLRSTRRFV